MPEDTTAPPVDPNATLHPDMLYTNAGASELVPQDSPDAVTQINPLDPGPYQELVDSAPKAAKAPTASKK